MIESVEARIEWLMNWGSQVDAWKTQRKTGGYDQTEAFNDHRR